MGDQQQVLHRQAGGLIANKNPYTAEEGTLTVAEDVVSDREGVISNRRGFARYMAGNSLALGEFRGRLLDLSGGQLRIDDGLGNPASLGAFSAPTGARMRFLEVGRSLLFTSSQGVMKLDSPTGTPRRAGMPPGLDAQLAMVSGAWFLENHQVAYRVLWVRVDANGQEISGEPSWRVIAANPPGMSQAVDLTITVPQGVIAGDFFEVYRTEFSADASTSPGDDEFLLARVAITAPDISTGTVLFHDTYDPIYLGAPLPTNSSQDGISQANGRPPYSTDLALYRGFVHYMGDLKREPALSIQLLDLSGIVLEADSLSITRTGVSLTYTFSATEDPVARKFKVETAFTPAVNIRATAESLCRAINRDPGNTAVFCFYDSGEDDPPGKVIIRDRSVNVDAFTLSATANVRAKFSPTISSSGIAADEMSFPNRVVTSRYQEYEHVPRGEENRNDLGSSAAIMRGLTLTTSIIFLKRDGVWRRTGDSISDFSDFPLDAEIHVVAPDAAAVLDNQVYCATVSGLVRVSDAGIGLISWPIDQRLKRIFSFAGYDTASFAIAQAASFEYIFFSQENGGDTNAKVGWRWNHLTSKWMGRLRKDVRAGYVLSDKLFLAHAVDGYVLSERKSFNTSNDDYKDESIPISIASATTLDAVISYDYRVPLSAGFMLEQPEQYMSVRIATVTSLGGISYRVTFESSRPAFRAGNGQVSLPIFSEIRWRPETATNPSVLKHWQSTTISLEDEKAKRFELGWYTDVDSVIRWYDVPIDPPEHGWGLGGWGKNPWGDPSPQRSPSIRSEIPLPYERSHSIVQCLRHSRAKERYSILSLAFTFEATGQK